MADVISKAKRSVVMAAIRSSGNRGTELKLISVFKSHGITGWRRNQRLYGKPDFVFRSRRVVVFVDGCFWHNCPSHCRMPKSRKAFWALKISGNGKRDRKVNGVLRRQGWGVIRIWEHALCKPTQVAARIKAALATSSKYS